MIALEQAEARRAAGIPNPDAPLMVAYGMGVDSTAMLVALARAGVRPDAILFADTGNEKQATYDYEPVIQAWLARVGFPALVTVRYRPRNGRYTTLCPASKPDEVRALTLDEQQRSMLMERNAAPNLVAVEGLLRKATRKRPGSFTELLTGEKLVCGVEAA